MIKGSNGYVLLIRAGHHAVLAVIARKDARLGLVFLDSMRAASEVADVL
jgi:predicted regulator of Ras-like GTPase activity (Roadblock/LC7/MglB family)